MFSRIRVFFRSKYESVSAGIHRVIGQCKRYWTALVKAVHAARDFLAVPSGTNVFEPLTPVLLDPRWSHRYESELLSALRNDQVRNIAITGEYGAGKSSVIRTFVERHPELEFAFISLAAFGKDLDKDADSKMRLVAGQLADLLLDLNHQLSVVHRSASPYFGRYRLFDSNR